MSESNGTAMIAINAVTMRSDWVYFEPTEGKEPKPEDLPLWLNKAFVDWIRDNPNCTIRSTLGIVQNGMTIRLHVWFDKQK